MKQKKILKPILNEIIEDVSFNEIKNQEIINGYHFKEEEITDNIEDVEISSSIFEKVVFSSKLDKVDLLDVVFDTCDLSNLNFSNRSIHRVIFRNCKLVGTEFIESSLEDITFENCVMTYSNFTLSNMENIAFLNCDMNDSSINEVRWKNLSFIGCNFIGTELLYTSLDGLDFTTCNINGIRVDKARLKGMIVTSYQAVTLSELFGIIIKDY